MKGNGDVDALTKAVGQQDLQAVEALLRDGTDINARDSNGITALCCAAHNGKPAPIKFLLDKGARIDICDSLGNNALTRLLWTSSSLRDDMIQLRLSDEEGHQMAREYAETRELLSAAFARHTAETERTIAASRMLLAPLKISRPLQLKPRNPGL